MTTPEPIEDAAYVRGGAGLLYRTIHRTAMPGADGRAVVICPPLANELSNAQRVLVNLARRLAAHGVVACRFDYHGTGESEGDLGCCTIDTLVHSIHDVLADLRASGSATSFVLVGVRIGALFAALAPPPEVAGLLFVDAVLDGSAFVTELRLAATIGTRKGAAAPDPAALDVGGYRFSDALLRQLAATKAALPRAGGPRALLLSTIAGSRAGLNAHTVPSTPPRFWAKRDCFRAPGLEDAVIGRLDVLFGSAGHA